MLLSAIYWFMTTNGFTQKNFLIASMGVLIVAFGWGYILATDLLAPKKEMDRKLSHLSKEILHELNIPLSTIQANSSMLKKSLSDEKSIKRLDRIDNASLRLKRLYEELLYNINKEIHVIKKETFSLKSLIFERVEIFEAFKRNKFDINIVDYTVVADKIGFEQMIDNLLNNAMKYSHKDTTISIFTKDSNLLIKDRGIGIDNSKIVQIFERYYQTDQKNSGDGIGLALVKSYCDEMQIDIHIDSTLSVGTTIILGLSSIINTNLTVDSYNSYS